MNQSAEELLQGIDVDLSRVLHEMAGAASMCWTPLPSSAVFDSTQAIEHVEAAITAVRTPLWTAP
jgi:hypothetical protein